MKNEIKPFSLGIKLTDPTVLFFFSKHHFRGTAGIQLHAFLSPGVCVCVCLCVSVCVCMCRLYCVQLSVIPWTVVQTPLSVGVSRQEHWGELQFPPPRELSDPGAEPMSLASPALASTLFTNCATWEAP